MGKSSCSVSSAEPTTPPLYPLHSSRSRISKKRHRANARREATSLHDWELFIERVKDKGGVYECGVGHFGLPAMDKTIDKESKTYEGVVCTAEELQERKKQRRRRRLKEKWAAKQQ